MRNFSPYDVSKKQAGYKKQDTYKICIHFKNIIMVISRNEFYS